MAWSQECTEMAHADLLCKASRQQLPSALSEASTLAGRRRDAALGDFRLSFTSNNQRVGRVLVSGCGDTPFLSFPRICAGLILERKGVNWEASCWNGATQITDSFLKKNKDSSLVCLILRIRIVSLFYSYSFFGFPLPALTSHLWDVSSSSISPCLSSDITGIHSCQSHRTTWSWSSSLVSDFCFLAAKLHLNEMGISLSRCLWDGFSPTIPASKALYKLEFYISKMPRLIQVLVL